MAKFGLGNWILSTAELETDCVAAERIERGDFVTLKRGKLVVAKSEADRPLGVTTWDAEPGEEVIVIWQGEFNCVPAWNSDKPAPLKKSWRRPALRLANRLRNAWWAFSHTNKWGELPLDTDYIDYESEED